MEIYLNGNYEKSISLFNQQETLIFKFKGSSETYTQSSSLKNCNNNSFIFNSAKPDHILEYNINFVNWFVGFTEGDGCFLINKKNNRVSFVITQKDIKVLYYIKKNLGFGKVYLCKDGYYRFIVSKFINLQYLIQLFSGKLILSNSNIKFLNWIKAYIQFYKLQVNLIIKEIDLKINLDNSWLSGFIDAEGYFDAFKRSKRLSYRMRFSIKQVNEEFFFLSLPYIWDKIPMKVGSTFIKKKLVVYTIDSLSKLKYLINYLDKYPLRSNKNIAFCKWLRLYRILLDGCRGKDFLAIQKLAQGINKYEDEDKVHKS